MAWNLISHSMGQPIAHLWPTILNVVPTTM
jgi:hypothetical protein